MVNHTYLLGVFLFTSKTFSQNTYFGKRDQLNSQLTKSLPFKSQKQNTTFTLSTPRGYSESTLYDPISPFQQIYGQNCGKVDSDRILFDKNGDRIAQWQKSRSTADNGTGLTAKFRNRCFELFRTFTMDRNLLFNRSNVEFVHAFQKKVWTNIENSKNHVRV